tara:strand:+ start:1581 stop:1925 length:345 start_codon:yes stop_codon:yes gene_type:complete
MNNLLLAFLLFLLGQTLIWIQTNGQFIWEWFKNHPFLLSITLGSSVSYIFIYATKLVVEHYNGLLWPGRLIGFGSGILSFTLLTWWFFDEGVNVKTIISLSLAISLILIQLFWK